MVKERGYNRGKNVGFEFVNTSKCLFSVVEWQKLSYFSPFITKF